MTVTRKRKLSADFKKEIKLYAYITTLLAQEKFNHKEKKFKANKKT